MGQSLHERWGWSVKLRHQNLRYMYDSAKLKQVTQYIWSHNSYECRASMHNMWSCSMMSCTFQGDKWMVRYTPDPFWVEGLACKTKLHAVQLVKFKAFRSKIHGLYTYVTLLMLKSLEEITYQNASQKFCIKGQEELTENWLRSFALL